MSKKVWYCDAFVGATYKHLLPFFSALNAERGGAGNHYGAEPTEEQLNNYKRNDLGEPLPADCFPTKVFNIGPWKYRKKINPIMNNGFFS